MRTPVLCIMLIAALALAGTAVVKGKQDPAAKPVPKVSVAQPHSDGRITCAMGSDGLYRCPVNGTAEGVTPAEFQLLLWVKPVRPAGEGWYLQRGGLNGISGIRRDGTWEAMAQIGNIQYPPREGHVLDIAVTVAARAEANPLLSAEGVVVRGVPVGMEESRVTGVSVHLQ